MHIAKDIFFRKLLRFLLMENKQTRKDNLFTLRDECKPQTVEELSKRTGVASNYLYQITGASKSGRDMGDQVARRLEVGMKKPPGWMDLSHNGELTEAEFLDLPESEQIHEIVSGLAFLNPEDTAAVLRIVRSLVSSSA